MPSDLDSLIEMGFPKNLAEEALIHTNNRGLEAAMDWLFEHQGKGEDVDQASESPAAEGEPKTTEMDASAAPEKHAKSLKCVDCNKLLRNNDEVQLHSARTGHVNYSESADEIRPLTEEEKKLQLAKLQDLLRSKKQERLEHEREAELEREKQRRIQGKHIVSAKVLYEEEEMRRFVEEKKRQKEEDREYKARLKAEIARDREERKMRELGEVPTPTVPPPPYEPKPAQRPTSTACRLHIRLPDGSALTNEFGASEPLSAVILYISQHWPDCPGIDTTQIQVLTNFPKHEFSDKDLQTSLAGLGLCPSSALIARVKRV
ncbi:unnamed protein product [Calicophoron daubneyi]|uniref:UBX domain-containing protein 1 n=1 Tax=Calicophoron daubneyi TaxID=300641 RepID=A0AAV2TZ68_CALDB